MLTYNVDRIFDEVRKEFFRAAKIHGPMRSSHEGYAIIKEEVDELWDDVKANASGHKMQAEAVQIAAMAVRFILDVTGYPNSVAPLPTKTTPPFHVNDHHEQPQ